MFRDGRYSISFGAGTAMGDGTVVLCDGVINGMTNRGTPLQGSYRLDAVRNLVRFEMTALMRPNSEAVTGLRSGDQMLPVMFRGEAQPELDDTQFTIKFVGRAITVTARYIGPADRPA